MALDRAALATAGGFGVLAGLIALLRDGAWWTPVVVVAAAAAVLLVRFSVTALVNQPRRPHLHNRAVKAADKIRTIVSAEEVIPVTYEILSAVDQWERRASGAADGASIVDQITACVRLLEEIADDPRELRARPVADVIQELKDIREELNGIQP